MLGGTGRLSGEMNRAQPVQMSCSNMRIYLPLISTGEHHEEELAAHWHWSERKQTSSGHTYCLKNNDLQPLDNRDPEQSFSKSLRAKYQRELKQTLDNIQTTFYIIK